MPGKHGATSLQRRGQTCSRHPQHPAQLAACTGTVARPKARAMGRRFSGRCLLSLHSNLAGFAGAGLLIYLACLCGEWLSHREGASEEKDGVGDLQEWGGDDSACRWMGKASFDPPAFKRKRKWRIGKETSLAGELSWPRRCCPCTEQLGNAWSLPNQ